MLDRRTILTSSAAMVLSSLLAGPGSAQMAQRVRRSATTPEGKAMLRVYAEGVRAMKALQPRDDARAWDFQWFIHGTPDERDATIGRIFGNAVGPRRNLAVETWYTCQPHRPGDPQEYFFPWHRLYVMYFEEIIRTLTQREDFALPYWDYTSPESYAIPGEFRDRADSLLSVLFVADRNRINDVPLSADVNAGEPLNKNFPASRNPLVLPTISGSSYSGFSRQLERGLHGWVHVYTGTSTNMGDVPTAAGDPVFWLHHCNIDRIWAGWNEAGGRNPTETNGKPWSDTKFVFADQSGSRIEVAISTISSSAALPYAYDVLPRADASPLVVSAASPREDTTLLRSIAPGVAVATTGLTAAATAAPVPLGADPQVVVLAPTPSGDRLPAVARALSLAGGSRVVLTLKDVQVQANPQTVYQVFLDLPQNASQDVADRHYVGLLNFFGVPPASGRHAGHGGQSASGDRATEFDVTELVARLGTANSLQNNTTVTLIPLRPPAGGSSPMIAGGIEILRR